MVAQDLEGRVAVGLVARHQEPHGQAGLAAGGQGRVQVGFGAAQLADLVRARQRRFEGRQQARRIDRLDQEADRTVARGLALGDSLQGVWRGGGLERVMAGVAQDRGQVVQRMASSSTSRIRRRGASGALVVVVIRSLKITGAE